MNRLAMGSLALVLAAIPLAAQSLDELKIQIHGYATQGFLYSTQNNMFTTRSSDGSPAWTEAVINVTAQPASKLRVGVQARYFLLGNLGNAITLDWAEADYKVNERFGVRFGKVKTPSGLFNEIQDIDPGYIWSLLPQGIYPITSRNSLLAHNGGVVYGTLNFGSSLGKLEYRGWGGERFLGSDDGYFMMERELGIVLPNGLSYVNLGAALHWRTPLRGLTVGASESHNNRWSAATTATIPGYGTFNGTASSTVMINQPQYFGQFEKNKLMAAAEYSRAPARVVLQIPGVFSETLGIDYRAWYAMATYRFTNKLTAGLYDMQFVDHQAALGPMRYSKDWTVSGRYDFNQYIYAKAEEHLIQGTALGYDIDLNPPTAALPTGLEPTTKLTLLKIGVSF